MTKNEDHTNYQGIYSHIIYLWVLFIYQQNGGGGTDSQIISILSSHNGVESFMRHLYYSLSAFDGVKHVKLVFEKKRKIMKANEAKSPQDHGHREPAKILLMFSPISAH